jgi:hypothetical protein
VGPPHAPFDGQPTTSGSQPSASQPSLDDLTRAAASGDGWLPENAVDPGDLQPGRAVRHRWYGAGTIVWVRLTGQSTSLLIRFLSGDRDIAFGLGQLEFAQIDGGTS